MQVNWECCPVFPTERRFMQKYVLMKSKAGSVTEVCFNFSSQKKQTKKKVRHKIRCRGPNHCETAQQKTQNSTRTQEASTAYRAAGFSQGRTASLTTKPTTHEFV